MAAVPAILSAPTHETYRAHARALCGTQSAVTPSTHVQVRRKGEVLCGRVEDLASFHGGEWFKVRTAVATGWVPASNVRLCAGLDHLCQCEAVAPVRDAQGAAL